MIDGCGYLKTKFIVTRLLRNLIKKAYHETHSVPVVTSRNSRGHGMDCVARQSGNVIHCFIWHHDLCTNSQIPERPWNGTGFENALPK